MRTLTLLALAACGTPSTDTTDPIDETDDVEACAYPEGATEPMAVGEVLTPYRWPTAIHGDGRTNALDVGKVACADDDVIDWSPHDALLFVSIPAW